MGAAESLPQEMQKNTNGTITIDCLLVEQHLQEMSTLKSKLESALNDNKLSKQNLEESEKCKRTTQVKLDKKIEELIKNLSILSESELKRKNAEDAVQSLRVENESLKKLNDNFQSLMVEYESRVNDLQIQSNQITQELQKSNKKFEENNNMWNMKYGKLTSQNSKQQSELQRYKSNKNAAQLVELQQLLQKLTSQIESATKKFTKEMQNKKRPLSESELENASRLYQQNINTLALLNIKMEHQNFPIMLKAYKDSCETNDKKILEAMKTVYDINKEATLLKETLLTQIPASVEKVKSLAEKYTKDIEVLKQKTFFNDFKQEEKLYADLLPVLEEIKFVSNSIPNNLNKSTSKNSAPNFKVNNQSFSKDVPAPVLEATKFAPKNLPQDFNITEKDVPNFKADDSPSCSQDVPISSAKNKKKNKNKNKNGDAEKPSPAGWNFDVFDKDTKNYSVILYEFPENTLSGVEHDAIDLINIKYFLGKLDLGDIENVTIQRLPIADSGNIRPVVVNLFNMEAVDRILGCTQKLSKMGLSNVKIAKFNGKM